MKTFVMEPIRMIVLPSGALSLGPILPNPATDISPFRTAPITSAGTFDSKNKTAPVNSIVSSRSLSFARA